MKPRWEVVIKDIKGGIVSRDGFVLRRNAERAAARSNNHAASVVTGLRAHVPGIKLPADQLYYASVERADAQ